LRAVSAKTIEKEAWSLSKENAFLNGAAEAARSLGTLSGESPDDHLLRALTIYLEKSPARKRFLVTLLDRQRKQQRQTRDEAALIALLDSVKRRIADATTLPTSLGDRFRRILARI
jgi:hypothetical protein